MGFVYSILDLCMYLHLCIKAIVYMPNRRFLMAINFDDKKSINDYLKKTNIHSDSFASMCKRQAAGIMLVSDEMDQERREQEELAKLQEKRFERKKMLLFDNLDLILRHREEILETPRYRNIDVHYAIEGGGCYIGPLRTVRQFNFAGTLVNINLKLGTLLEVWDTDQFKVECKCGGTAVIRYFSGSPLSGCSVATAFCPKCKDVIHGIRNRSFGDYYGLMKIKLDECFEMVVKDFVAKWTLAKAEYAQKVAEGMSSRWSSAVSEFHGDGKLCDLETMINELKMREYVEMKCFGEL